MAVVDQRILIPVSQEIVWMYLSDLSNNPQWQADCVSVSFLSSKREGRGTRIRTANGKRQEMIVEITSWYNGLGYEYTYIDGSPYKSSKGRIRLQEIAEGTIVQWTFEYELKGFLGRGGHRQIENTMTASLKSLYRKAKEFSKQEGVQAKSLMQEAPDVEARSMYTPRHAPVFDEKRASSPPTVASASTPEASTLSSVQHSSRFDFEDEPEIKVDDTRPNPVIAPAPAAVESEVSTASAYENISEPDFLSDLSISEADAAFMLPSTIGAEAAVYTFDDLDITTSSTEVVEVESAIFEESELETTAGVSPSIYDAVTEPLDMFVADAPAENALAPQPELDTSLSMAESPIASVAELEASAAVIAPQEDKHDLPVALPQPITESETAHKSIWDIFNVPRPSEVEVSAVTNSKKATHKTGETAAVSLPVDDESYATRRGLRAKLRRKSAHLRYPD